MGSDEWIKKEKQNTIIPIRQQAMAFAATPANDLLFRGNAGSGAEALDRPTSLLQA